MGNCELATIRSLKVPDSKTQRKVHITNKPDIDPGCGRRRCRAYNSHIGDEQLKSGRFVFDQGQGLKAVIGDGYLVAKAGQDFFQHTFLLFLDAWPFHAQYRDIFLF